MAKVMMAKKVQRNDPPSQEICVWQRGSIIATQYALALKRRWFISSSPSRDSNIDANAALQTYQHFFISILNHINLFSLFNS